MAGGVAQAVDSEFKPQYCKKKKKKKNQTYVKDSQWGSWRVK
jgi:hypothetical protein